jgi:hypothetical protein
MCELEGEDMAILARFGKRPLAGTLAGWRIRETRPLPPADRRRIAQSDTSPSHPKFLQPPRHRHQFFDGRDLDLTHVHMDKRYQRLTLQLRWWFALRLVIRALLARWSSGN